MAWVRRAGAIFAIGSAAALIAQPGAASGSGAAGQPAAAREPEKIYRTTCGYCHGHNVGPIIRGRALPPEAIEYMVRNGNGAMPAFRATEITPAELAALARWISASKADPKEHGQ